MLVKRLKDKRCKNCGKFFKPYNSLQKACSIPCAIDYTKKMEGVRELKEWKVRKKEMKEELKKISEYKHEARRDFQMWVRMRDKNDPCISCGATVTEQWDGGHYFKAELYSGLIFNEDNCHKQCSRCNNELHGNEANYRIGLVKKIGEDRVKWLEENKDRLRTYKYSKEELIEIRKVYKLKIKELNKV